jgi:hypothetical protein
MNLSHLGLGRPSLSSRADQLPRRSSPTVRAWREDLAHAEGDLLTAAGVPIDARRRGAVSGGTHEGPLCWITNRPIEPMAAGLHRAVIGDDELGSGRTRSVWANGL